MTDLRERLDSAAFQLRAKADGLRGEPDEALWRATAALCADALAGLEAAEERGRSADHYARQIRDTAHLIRGHLLDLERLLDSRYAGIDTHPILMLGRLLTDIRDSADAIERAAHADTDTKKED